MAWKVVVEASIPHLKAASLVLDESDMAVEIESTGGGHRHASAVIDAKSADEAFETFSKTLQESLADLVKGQVTLVSCEETSS